MAILDNSRHESELGSDDLYTELWRACAGPLVDVPHRGERVFYFPQGHMEQLEASLNQELTQQIPQFNLPSKILCRVVHIQLLAEPETDEVYAQITLHPEVEQIEPVKPDPSPPDMPKRTIHSFCKTLTASDTSTHGGFSVHQRKIDLHTRVHPSIHPSNSYICSGVQKVPKIKYNLNQKITFHFRVQSLWN